jgi:hypothetical protein
VRGNPLSFLLRLLLGSAAGFYYFLVSGAVRGGGANRQPCDWTLCSWSSPAMKPAMVAAIEELYALPQRRYNPALVSAG